MAKKKQITDITRQIADKFNPEKIILFGSNAKGNFNADSDVDLIIVKESNLPKHKRGTEIRRLFYGLSVAMALKIYTPREFDRELQNQYSFLSSAMKNSTTLYERKT